MWYPTYLVHFNKNHSSKDGRFTSGDGDGDGIVNDHANRSKNGSGSRGKKVDPTVNNAAFDRSRKQLHRGIKLAVAGVAAAGISQNLASYAKALDNTDANKKARLALNGAAFITGLAGTAFDVSGVVNTAKGGMGMRKAVMDRKAGRS